jgi:RNA-directed DNA polymerase
MRIPDTRQLGMFDAGGSVAAAPLEHRQGGVDSANDRRTPTTLTTPGTRTSTTATRTGTTRTTSSGRVRSAQWNGADFSFSELLAAYVDCRRTKRSSAAALAFEARQEENLVALQAALADGSYRPGRSICFVITRPKPREVWAAPFPDRIPHHLLYNAIGPAIERASSPTAAPASTAAARSTPPAASRRRCAPSRATGRGRRLPQVRHRQLLRLDRQARLGEQLARRIPPFPLALARRDDPLPRPARRRRRARPPRAPGAHPAGKSLFAQDADHGLPIGNLSSQFFANVYLDELDQFVKHRLRVRHYVRYVDDFVLLHESPRQLNAWRDAIAAFLEERLGLRLNDAKTILQPVARGIDFVGQVIRPHRRTLRRRTFREALSRLDRARPRISGARRTATSACCARPPAATATVQTSAICSAGAGWRSITT